MQRAVAASLVAACALAGGCGRPAHPAAANGAAVFGKDCSSCHSLIGNESRHKQGGDLVGYAFSRPVLLQFTREMPTRLPLGRAQLRAVVDYVLRAERQGAHRG
jgi:hypothetical protein